LFCLSTTPGKTIPPRSLVVGTPARVIRALEDSEREMQKQRTLHYVELAHSQQ
jgi:carbonic anhydrase/acetyltransferase-like protein (isoleucine patch superfamily)